MDLKMCDGCRVARWFYETYGVIICLENCPHRKDGEKDARSSQEL